MNLSSQVKSLNQEEQNRISQDFYQNLDDNLGSRSSAKEIIPLIIELIHPQSVIDLGCGVGSWLAVFKEFGVQDVLGVDVDYIDKQFFQIPEEQFLAFDLKNPLKLDKQFDLVMSLEVAAYLPKECAEIFVDSLTKLAPVVLFSSAVPFQDNSGIQINQQWPDYWVNYFQQKGYVVLDCLRKKVWKNPNVKWWFAQNTLLFVSQNYLKNNQLIKREFDNTDTSQLSIVHPQMYLDKRSFRALLSELPIAANNAIKKRLKRLFK